MDGHLQSDHYKPSKLPSSLSHGQGGSPQMASQDGDSCNFAVTFTIYRDEIKEQPNKFSQIFKIKRSVELVAVSDWLEGRQANW